MSVEERLRALESQVSKLTTCLLLTWGLILVFAYVAGALLEKA